MPAKTTGPLSREEGLRGLAGAAAVHLVVTVSTDETVHPDGSVRPDVAMSLKVTFPVKSDLRGQAATSSRDAAKDAAFPRRIRPEMDPPPVPRRYPPGPDGGPSGSPPVRFRYPDAGNCQNDLLKPKAHKKQ